MRLFANLFFALLIMAVVDWYAYQAVRAVFSFHQSKWKLWLSVLYWGVAVASWCALFFLPKIFAHEEGHFKFILITVILGLYIGKLLVAIFLIIDDLRRGGVYLWELVNKSPDSGVQKNVLTRARFLSQLGLIVGGSFFGIFMYGLSNKYNYRIHRIKLRFPNLPPAFNGLKIVQLSDIHTGSFTRPSKVEEGIEMALKEEPDLFLFTGDLVNNRTRELSREYREMFGRLHAPMGVYSILGNHDYGDYVKWSSEEEKQANLQRLKDMQADMGWKMLNNEHTILEKNGEQIALIGVENWSALDRFPTYGDMKKATKDMPNLPFQILMSHDPTHWDAEIRMKYPQVDLMLAGHTHGMQFGVEIPGFKWSPAQFMYKQWAGLYREADQYLYVNRGYGFLGYPGRVGILPEITVFELYS